MDPDKIVYEKWDQANCPKCGWLSILRKVGGGSVSFDYNEWMCSRCGRIWGENHRKPGFLFQIREAIYRSS